MVASEEQSPRRRVEPVAVDGDKTEVSQDPQQPGQGGRVGRRTRGQVRHLARLVERIQDTELARGADAHRHPRASHQPDDVVGVGHGYSTTVRRGRSSTRRPGGEAEPSSVAGVCTVIIVRSARKRSCEDSKGTPGPVAGDPGDREERGTGLDGQDGGLVGGGRGDLDVLLGLTRVRVVVLGEEVVERTAERPLQEPRKAGRRELRVLQGDRDAVGQPDPHHVEDVGIGGQAQRRPCPVVSGHDAGAHDAGTGGHPLSPQQRGHAHHPRQVALDLAAAHEGAATSARHAAYRPRRLQGGEGLPDRRPAHAQLDREVALSAEARARTELAAADLLLQPGQHPFRSRTDGG